MTPFPNRLTTGLAALAACMLFSSCSSSKTGTYADGVVDYTNPNPKLSKEEYPFDEKGNYREDWAARGAGVSGVKDTPTVRTTAAVKTTAAMRDTPTDTALYTQSSDNRGPMSHPAYTPDTPVVDYSAPTSGGGGSATPRHVSSTSSSSGSRSTASNSGSSKPKPKSSSGSSKPKPKPKPSSTVVKVKPSDTLYGLSLKYGVSVASIKSANGLKSDMIVDGKSLKIPRKK